VSDLFVHRSSAFKPSIVQTYAKAIRHRVAIRQNAQQFANKPIASHQLRPRETRLEITEFTKGHSSLSTSAALKDQNKVDPFAHLHASR